MAFESNLSEVSKPKIGRYYLVPSVIANLNSFVDKLPKALVVAVQGPVHNDADIGSDFNHQHIDWRFVEDNVLEIMMGITTFSMPWERVLLPNLIEEDSLLSRPMCYRRHFKNFPSPKFLAKILEPRYKDSVMKDFICPHKGTPCNNTPTKNGVIVCRGHGLAWDAATGTMVPRISTQKAI